MSPMSPMPQTPSVISKRVEMAPGLVYAGAVAGIGFAINGVWSTVSPLTAALALSVMIGNVGVFPPQFSAGTRFASRQLLRFGIVLLGLQLSISQVTDLGPQGFALIAGVVAVTFVAARALGRVIKVSDDLSLLTATGFAICGVSAVSAMVGAIDAEEEDATYAIALVTLFGSLSIVVLPLLGGIINMSDTWFGAWAGSSVHDVAQVVATATAYSHDSLASATIVKLTRVVLLAPIVAAVVFWRRRRTTSADSPGPSNTHRTSPSLVPGFIIAFLAMVVVRSTGVLPDGVLDMSKQLERVLLAMALVGLGSHVRFRELRVLGVRPLILGLTSWLVVMSVALVTSSLIDLSV